MDAMILLLPVVVLAGGAVLATLLRALRAGLDDPDRGGLRLLVGTPPSMWRGRRARRGR